VIEIRQSKIPYVESSPVLQNFLLWVGVFIFVFLEMIVIPLFTVLFTIASCRKFESNLQNVGYISPDITGKGTEIVKPYREITLKSRPILKTTTITPLSIRVKPEHKAAKVLKNRLTPVSSMQPRLLLQSYCLHFTINLEYRLKFCIILS